jgi:hypothetical protein
MIWIFHIFAYMKPTTKKTNIKSNRPTRFDYYLSVGVLYGLQLLQIIFGILSGYQLGQTLFYGKWQDLILSFTFIVFTVWFYSIRMVFRRAVIVDSVSLKMLLLKRLGRRKLQRQANPKK